MADPIRSQLREQGYVDYNPCRGRRGVATRAARYDLPFGNALHAHSSYLEDTDVHIELMPTATGKCLFELGIFSNIGEGYLGVPFFGRVDYLDGADLHLSGGLSFFDISGTAEQSFDLPFLGEAKLREGSNVRVEYSSSSGYRVPQKIEVENSNNFELTLPEVGIPLYVPQGADYKLGFDFRDFTRPEYLWIKAEHAHFSRQRYDDLVEIAPGVKLTIYDIEEMSFAFSKSREHFKRVRIKGLPAQRPRFPAVADFALRDDAEVEVSLDPNGLMFALNIEGIEGALYSPNYGFRVKTSAEQTDDVKTWTRVELPRRKHGFVSPEDVVSVLIQYDCDGLVSEVKVVGRMYETGKDVEVSETYTFGESCDYAH